jgi:hypothetical protein
MNLDIIVDLLIDLACPELTREPSKEDNTPAEDAEQEGEE